MLPIEVSGLKKSYGKLKAVDDISFSVNPGEVFSLLGPNGAGKTTTVEIIEGLRKRDGGDVKVLGLDPWQDGYELHKKIGVMPQNFTFYPRANPREAVIYYADLFGIKVDPNALLREVILEDSAKNLFENLSGGQKQKTGMALALVNSPELLFLDEPTTGLDPSARRAVWEVILRLKSQGRTILMTTHYLEEAEHLSDRVAIVNSGKIIAYGTPGEIIKQHGSGETLQVNGDERLAAYLRENTKLPVDFDGKVIKVSIIQAHDVITVVSTLEQSGMAWSDLRTHRDSLEDVFIKLVGGTVGEHGQVIGTDHSNSSEPEGKK